MKNQEEDDDDKDAVYKVKDLEEYCKSIAKRTSEEFDVENWKEILDYISLEQIEQIARDFSLGESDDGFLIINEEKYLLAIEEVLTRVQSLIIAKLASEGFLECAWDDEINDMVFWLSEEGEKEQEKEE